MASTNTTLPPDRFAQFGFTTTPDERIGPGAPYTSPSLQVNLFFRVFLGLVSLFVTWVPARLLWRNGEFAGAVICIMLLVLNLITVINALIWRDDNVQTWWAGQGWCDIMTYTYFAMHTAFNICMFEIMRGLASKISLSRADKPTRSERRRQRIVSALVIFTVPVIQVILTYFTTFGRYNVSTLIGCSAVYYPNWLYLVFYILPTPVFAVGAAYMAALTFYRYRKIDKVTREVARSKDGVAAARQDRVRKKLYFMTLVCIIVVLPLIMVLLFLNIIEGAPWDLPYDFDTLHFGPDPFNVYFISFTTSDMMSFSAMNIVYIGEIAGIAVFIPFGTTPEALNMYRGLLLAAGLGYVFPKLKEEYVPRAKRGGSSFSWGSLAGPLRGMSLLGTSSSSTHKDSLLPTAEQISITSRVDRARSSSLNQNQHEDLTMSGGIDSLSYPEKTVSSSTANHNPWPDLSVSEIDAATAQIEAGPLPPAQNPYNILPTPFNKPLPKFPSLHIPTTQTHKTEQQQHQPSTFLTLLPTPSPKTSLRGNQFQSQPHSAPPPTTSPLPSATPTPKSTNPYRNHQTTPWATTTPPTTTPSPNITTTPHSITTTPHAGITPHPHIGVATRVWATNNPNNPNTTTDADTPETNAYWKARLRERACTTTISTEGVVRVETSIARRSVEVDLERAAAAAAGLGEKEMGMGRRVSNAAS
ncbi:pheromone A receptor-domain-containing protein [Chaetomium tenue]|uniref:Pheromone A receptor-domain-containing protein n=1 Tax=Chaetomium tenue TaxID=1854479 RepID=A0ACB7P1Q7_9PEZI|nr:pheromone A receptor-domain-containing protein [Chaetomium globosum]